jgi:hypothetical protein
MPNKLQLKRTTVSGRTPNTTNSGNTTYIDVGELAINVSDGKLFSSNGSAVIEFGTGTPVYDANGNLITTTYVTQATYGPAFSVYPNSSIQQAISSGSQQKVLFQLEEYDTNNNFANSTFTPTVAGYYQLNATVRMAGTMGTGESMLVIWKNGSEHKRGWNASGTEVGASFFAMSVSTLVYANGTTDYFEVYVQQSSGSSRDVTVAGGNITWFNGAMVRGA